MWLVYLLTTVHIIVCLFLVIVVLLQSGKAADLAGAFGGMGSQTAFGPRGAATVLSKATAIAAGVFMITSISLSLLGTRTAGVGGGSKSVLEKSATPAPKATQVPLNLPGGAPGTPADPSKAPSVTLTDPQSGSSQTIPLDLSKPNGGLPQGKQPPPAQKK